MSGDDYDNKYSVERNFRGTNSGKRVPGEREGRKLKGKSYECRRNLHFMPTECIRQKDMRGQQYQIIQPRILKVIDDLTKYRFTGVMG